jgi:hypothetical protein
MTGFTTPSGSVGNSSNRGTFFEGWRAFDHDTDWSSGSFGWQSSTLPAWLSYQFDTAQTVYSYKITTASNRKPATFTFEGRNGTDSWTVLDTQTGLTLADEITTEFTLAAPATYEQFRINVTNIFELTGYVWIAELELIG